MAPTDPQAPARCVAVIVGLTRGSELGPLNESNGRSASVVVDLPQQADPASAVQAYLDQVELVIDEAPAR